MKNVYFLLEETDYSNDVINAYSNEEKGRKGFEKNKNRLIEWAYEAWGQENTEMVLDDGECALSLYDTFGNQFIHLTMQSLRLE